MRAIVQGIRYRNLDQAREVLRTTGVILEMNPFDDAGKEPEGLLSVITEDLIGEEAFYRLFDAGEGTVVRLVRKPYSGFGPPAQEPDYMGFVSRGVCYVLEGSELAIEVEDCPLGAQDLHHLESMVMEGAHPLDRDHLAVQLGLSPQWTFDDLFDWIAAGEITATQIDQLIHGSPRTSRKLS